MECQDKYSVAPLFLLGFAILLLANSCKVNYSFTGASVSPDVKTIYVGYFVNNASIVEPLLSQKLTESMKDKFVSETSLVMTSDGTGDLLLEGSVDNYTTQPVAIQGNDQAAMNRLTITISVRFTNNKNPDQSFESNFSRYADYQSNVDLNAVKESLIGEINTMLVEDVFNKALVNW